ncbi:MAG: molybdenum cofactor guanylyltransferase, partial [Gammaproteobacteria bacterium]|nr:molybdenum cofactor guanylyltransferase [Gammaproteobacteria bacterium]
LNSRGQALVGRVLARLEPQVGKLLISANHDLARYREFGCPVVPDSWGDGAGPLAGILSALRVTTTPYLLIVPCDVPDIPRDLCQRLARATPRWHPRVVHDGQRRQSALMLLHRRLLPQLQTALESGERSLNRWLDSEQASDIRVQTRHQVLRNINDPQTLRRDRLQRPPAG